MKNIILCLFLLKCDIIYLKEAVTVLGLNVFIKNTLMSVSVFYFFEFLFLSSAVIATSESIKFFTFNRFFIDNLSLKYVPTTTIAVIPNAVMHIIATSISLSLKVVTPSAAN